MNYRLMLEKTVDLLINVAVASVAVSIFEEKWYGFILALIAYTVAMLISSRIGDTP
ncbi:MAG: hypothetical protein IJY48_01815 [Mailhella sp.]|nr:hypothetical protein [Mailhella sp.]